ncbi:MAG: hypothetical protein ABIZ49_13305, partial [Opitutaceae bacterium]
LGLRLTLIVVAVVLIAVPFALLVLEVIFKGPLVRLDQRIANNQNVADLRDGDRVTLARIITELGSTQLLIGVVVLTCAYLALFHRRRRQALYVAATAVLGVTTNNIIKAVVARSRPHPARCPVAENSTAPSS